MQRRDTLKAMGAGLTAAMLPWPAGAQGGRQPTGYLRTSWGRDPYSLGAYSYNANGSTREDRLRLEAPVADRLFFAGEAVYPFYNSTVHAALESGRRTAEAVLGSGAGRIGIVGAGVSGLAAAQALAERGLDVTVLEARDRIGGRLWTDSSLGPPLDLGASWIHGTRDNPLTDIADDMDARRIVTGDSLIIRGAGGRRIAEGDAPGWHDRVTVYEHGYGADIAALDLDQYDDLDEYAGPDVVLAGGYADLLPWFDGDYDLRLSSPVSVVDHSGAGVTLGLDSGASDDFDAVIVTVPLGVLQAGTIRFLPALPADKRLSINRIGMGLLDKLYLAFDEVFWDRHPTWISTIETGLPQGQFTQWLNLAAVLDVPVLLGFNAGNVARGLAALPDDALVALGVRALRSAYPT